MSNILCSICNLNIYNTKCEECNRAICSNKKCHDPNSINIKQWTCCIKCYEYKLQQEIQYQIENGLLDQCIHCGHADLYTKCSCEVSEDDILNYYMSKVKISNN